MSTVTFPFDTKAHAFQKRAYERPPQHQLNASLIQRNKERLDKLELTFQLSGVFSLPDGWKSKIDDPTEQMYQYEIKMYNMHLKGGKVVPRQLSEEEKAEAEAAKNKKGAPPAKDPKKKGQEDEISAEEKERIEREQAEKEQKMEYYRQQWQEYSNQEKFERYCEDSFKEPSIKFIDSSTGNQEPVTITLNGEDLLKFEEDVFERQGVYLYFDKLAPAEDEDPKKGGAKAAPKKGGTEEMKPVHGRVFLDLTQLLIPGNNTQVMKQLIETYSKNPEGEGSQEQVFEPSQTYIYYSLSLDQPIYPYIYTEQLSQVVLNKAFYSNTAVSLPDTNAAVREFHRTINVIVKEIGVEYNRVFTGEGTMQGSDDKDSPRGQKPGSTIYSTPAQQREMREQRKEKFLIEFNVGSKYSVLREKLKKSVLRFVVEKYKREIGNKNLTQEERAKFKANLYVYVNELMKKTLSDAIDQNKEQIHQDIWMQKDSLRDDKQNKINKSFNENFEDKCKRLYKEFDIKNDQENSEKWLLNCLYDCKYRPYPMYRDYARFCLKYGMYLRAEYYLEKLIEESEYSNLNRILQATLLVQRGNFKGALEILNQVLDSDWKDYKANILMGLLYDKLERPGLSRKHFAIAKCRKLRELNLLPPKSNQPKNFRTIQEEFKIQAVDFKITKDQQLSYDQQDLLYFEFIEFLLEYWVYDLAEFTLSYIKDNQSERFLMTQAKIRVQQRNFPEAVQSLDKILGNDPKNQAAWILRGHAFFMANNLFDSEESYIKALRLKPPVKDQILQERLGIVYARRKAWKDAKVVFAKCCKEFTSTTSWMYLGLALLRLGELSLAEDAFTQANILDNFNPKIWGYMCILCLTVGKDRKFQAQICFREALKTGLNDTEILEEIGDLYVREGYYDQATESFAQLIKIDPKHGEGWQKLADVYCNNLKLNKERSNAIDAYKKAIELVEGENNKSKIALTLKELLQAENREDEIEPFRKYLLDESLTQ
ncbi:tetratricopeptide repeat protein [Stylonychia lemnae]|uniref:Tetratricopeptide repeat protein n=1 Tax=Stylonychia lemnae TaxID=5949 RepID=A0A077ZVY8_STYLE|nr:tetratricopeptide repeat protein [Stylonychia lemnae]|eukprot:CDW74115.1 tetratricopeptide repeat protein [Stylonychia lemnae]